MKLYPLIKHKILNSFAFAVWAKPSVKHMSDGRIKKLCTDKSVLWEIGRESGACSDHMEMSGFRSDSILCVGKSASGKLLVHRHITIPALRTLPNDTRGSFCFNVSGSVCKIKANGKRQAEHPQKVWMRGNLTVVSDSSETEITRTFINCADAPALIEKVEVKMKRHGLLDISVPYSKSVYPA